ncbi:glutathione S-transferase theta-1-like isoform X1 [Diabrotica virgifera virgifera]|uniref:Glutathione S-transferase theta-1-like isoform X1 n=1 Tax=Diabrotica virgifera virgifera TaxID=50390 RepID=A0A6P7GTV2_DIAVI|nr:glutathione S-transferase theta-1-like isoform X1 [Diabrotica virgifera virgifera]
MSVKLYYDLLSQPSRSLFIFFKKAQVPFEACLVNLGKGEHLKKEYLENVSRIPKVPVVHDGDFRLNESVGIVRYISRQYPVADNLYPKDSKKQALVDEYLEWHHLNVRVNCSTYFIKTTYPFYQWLNPMKTGRQPSEEEVRKAKKYMEKSLQDFQNYFLSNGKFINGDQISYADIHAACEIEQTRVAGYDVRDRFPKIKEWIEAVREECNPHYDRAHQFVNLISQKEEEPKSKL